MKTFGYGNREIKALSIKEGLEICQELDRLDNLKKYRESLRKNNYNHKFDKNDKCCYCNISRIDIYVIDDNNISEKICKGK